ncbi:hypothetical protein P106B_86 [Rhizobium phage vB_RglS_P106B]|uniref:DUF7352 domain-containing protein n=1 Tax=Rhizobium phage vB_RglS_P106B TaxID=1458697 RepID=W6E8Q5_9CAUD|nr:hypothetical protein P106B_86 [Rhizobium phage vB_RglS_P106B]AHJ10769.1 hypothetical protein P106B_86 [Rhizobium phage vB_RglS_P106B]
MKTIYKYPLEIADYNTILIPGGYEYLKIVHVGRDPYGTPCIWAEVDTAYPTMPVTAYIVGTGHPLPNPEQLRVPQHIGSFVERVFVWHVYI